MLANFSALETLVRLLLGFGLGFTLSIARATFNAGPTLSLPYPSAVVVV